MNPLRRLRAAGQSVWLDLLRRGLVTGGELKRLIDEDGLSGVTSNPTIFGKAIAGSADYEGPLREIVEKGHRDPLEVFYELALGDIQMAADLFREMHDETGGTDGFVSFELEPRLARDAEGSAAAARKLAERLGKPNVMIKVPGTSEGARAVEELTAAGVSVNITLLFSVEAYERVAHAYVDGLQRRLDQGLSLEPVASVASFFVSRVDTAVDRLLPEDSPLRGRAAIANAKVAYRSFRRIFSGERWDRLASAGARVQRPLWASTGTKDPSYRDVMYVEELVGLDTVNTMPPQTLNAFRDHGRVRPEAILEDGEEAEATLGRLAEEGVELDRIAAELLDEGLRAFHADLQALLDTLEARMGELREGRRPAPVSLGPLEGPVGDRLNRMASDDVARRIWRGDNTVWKPHPTEITDRLGWLALPEAMGDRVEELRAFAERAADDGLAHALLLGMGGSSLAPEMFARTFGSAAGALELVVLDSTHPATIARVEESLDLTTTLIVAGSKSGTTVETLSHLEYFSEKGGDGERFVAITDPGTPLEELARDRGFRAVFTNPPDIGGRYSALSLFGLVPAALIGADLHALLDGAAEMAAACDPCIAPEEDPGARLGAVMGEAARAGRDKLTLVLPPEVAAFGDWAEQLVAESTGKEGTGIVPVTGEDLGPPEVYGPDRLFVALGEHRALEPVAAAGHPVVQLDFAGPSRLGAELFRFEFATAVAGHVLGINPFDQPDVEEAKQAARTALDHGAADPPETPGLRDVLDRAGAGSYLAIQAYLDRTPEVEEALQRARLAIRDRHRVATTLGFGPRFLHSTGQLHKGGPATGLFVQVVDGGRDVDLAVPGKPYTFGELLDAQALGDLRALSARGRPVARVSLEELMEVV